MLDFIIIGGGAAGIFAALAAKKKNSLASVLLLEKSAKLLAKVRVSGGGRCNVTHACFDPKLLVKHYPRGEKELLGPFHVFQPRDTISWFENRGVQLKTEADGRMFPITDKSETIIFCLLEEAKKLGVNIQTLARIEHLSKTDEGFEIVCSGGKMACKNLLLATGSGSDGYRWAEELGHTIQKPVPSLFTFNIPTSPLKELSGISVSPVELKIEDSPFVQRGALLLTHFGFSGPAALKLSAWGARFLHQKDYKVELLVNWLPDLSEEMIIQKLMQIKQHSPQKMLCTENVFDLPKNLWKVLLEEEGAKRLADVSHKELQLVAKKLHKDSYFAEGKTTNKEEFVTCGGVTLKEVNFKTLESKICPHLFFAGELLDIDGVTGGFNFQNAWTTGFIAGNSAGSYN